MTDNQKRRSKEAFRTFVERTSMHGFIDMYNAKSCFWIIFWTVIIFGSFAVTTYQVIQAVDQYINQSVNTVITAAEKDEIYFPPFRLCYLHWIYWLDWKKAFSMNFTKGSVLFAMSYFDHTFSATSFDVNQAKLEFLQTLHSNNMSSMSEFYYAVARNIPITKNNKVFQHFEKTEIVFKHPNILLCYTIPETKISEILFDKNFVASSSGDLGFNFSIFDLGYEQVKEYVSVEEYSHYIGLWLNSFSVHQVDPKQFSKDFTTFTLPTVLFPNGFSSDSVQISPDNDEYFVKFSTSAHRWKNSASKPCVNNLISVFPNDTCYYTCISKFISTSCQCPFFDNAAFVKLDLPENLCPYDIHFISQIGSNDRNQIDKSWLKEKDPNCSINFNEPLIQKCKSNCNIPCETWFYTMSVSVRSMPNIVRFFSNKTKTSISINYPTSGEIFIATDYDTQSWESFIGNVGGLLGIWTGASILSIIQLLYYLSFCFKCSHPEEFVERSNCASNNNIVLFSESISKM